MDEAGALIAQVFALAALGLGILVGLIKGWRKYHADRLKLPVKKPRRTLPKRRRRMIDESSMTEQDLAEMDGMFGKAGSRPEDYDNK